MTAFDWSQFEEVGEEDVIPEISDAAPPETLDWEQFEELEPEKSPLQQTGKEIGRFAARTASRIGETVVGLPGDIIQLERSVRRNIQDQLSKIIPEMPEFIKEDPVRKLIQKSPDLLGKLPTSEELKQFSSDLTNQFTDPQGTLEEFGDEIVSLGTSLLMPAGIPKKISTVLKALGKATLAKGARKGAELYGAGEGLQTATEIGTLFLTGMIGKPIANAFVSDKYEKARRAIPKGTMVNTGKLSQDLKKVDAELAKGIKTNTKSEVRSALQELESKASGGSMEVEEVVQSYHDLNERMSSKKLFDELGTSERRRLKSRYDLVKKEVGKNLKEYGKHNPEFLKEWQEANQAYGTIEQSKKVSNWLSSKANKIPRHLVGAAAFEIFTGKPVIAAEILGAGGLAASGVKTGEILYRIANSPSLRKHYLDVIESITKENLPATIRSLEKLNRGLEKEES